MESLCVGIYIFCRCIWAHQRHVVEWSDQEAIIEHSQMNELF
jgi:hypothetical protein